MGVKPLWLCASGILSISLGGVRGQGMRGFNGPKLHVSFRLFKPTTCQTPQARNSWCHKLGCDTFGDDVHNHLQALPSRRPSVLLGIAEAVACSVKDEYRDGNYACDGENQDAGEHYRGLNNFNRVWGPIIV